jgi:Ca2+-transporting ATPase
VGVFARLSPEQKLRIVDALQAGGEVVAMTGDIVRAVEQGRVVYANILRFVHYLFSCNLAEILVGFVALMVGWPLLWGALEIHWLNMVTDVFPAMALALEPSDPDAMGRPPRDPRVALVTPQFLGQIARHGVLLSAATLLAFFVGMRWYGAEGEGLRRAGTVAFMTLALAQLFHAFSTRSRRDSAITARLFTNGWLWAATAACVSLRVAAVSVPYLRDVLRTVPLAASDCGVVLACSLAPAAVVELVKLARRAAGGVTQ